MNNILMVIHDPNMRNVEVLHNRLRALGQKECFLCFPNCWVIKTSKTTSELYDYLKADVLEVESMLIVQVAVKANGILPYWGRMNKLLWEFLKQEGR